MHANPGRSFVVIMIMYLTKYVVYISMQVYMYDPRCHFVWAANPDSQPARGISSPDVVSHVPGMKWIHGGEGGGGDKPTAWQLSHGEHLNWAIIHRYCCHPTFHDSSQTSLRSQSLPVCQSTGSCWCDYPRVPNSKLNAIKRLPKKPVSLLIYV